MMQFTIVITVVIASVFAVNQTEVDRINNAQNLWKGERNEITEKGEQYMAQLLGSEFSEQKDYRKDIEVVDNIPLSFDAREKWWYCPSIWAIKNQGNCGSCWAVTAASAISDRLCTSSNGKIKVNISAVNLLSCCTNCWAPNKQGCEGGYSLRAWAYFQAAGVVTGGDYRSNEGCQPYAIAPTKDTRKFYTPPCQSTCTNSKYGTSYTQDLYFGSSAYNIPADIDTIQSELLTNGPIEAGFIVFTDFFYYKTGVYIRTSSERRGGHGVKLLGWGVEDGVDYWLAANSWGSGWGEDGTFKIRRGTDECGFESQLVAGLMGSRSSQSTVVSEKYFVFIFTIVLLAIKK